MTLAFWCVALQLLLLWLWRIPVTFTLSRQPSGLDNHYPRQQQAKLTGFVARAQSAHENLSESIAPFGLAVVIAHLAHADPVKSGALAATHVLLRLVYAGLYLGDIASARSAVWILSYLTILGQIVLAAGW